MITSLLHHHQRVEPEASRSPLILALRSALKLGKLFAACKLGLSEKVLPLHTTILECSHTTQQHLALILQTRQHCARRADGPFPQHTGGHAQLYAKATRELDLLGLVSGRLEADLLDQLQPKGQTISLLELEPNRSVPVQSENRSCRRSRSCSASGTSRSLLKPCGPGAASPCFPRRRCCPCPFPAATTYTPNGASAVRSTRWSGSWNRSIPPGLIWP